MPKERILIWGKTYPELSTKHKETVCTGGCTEDGRPIRLYPIPLRYLPEHAKYSLYDWIEVPITRSTSDSRPESYRVDGEITKLQNVGTSNGWSHRRRIIFQDDSWQFECLDDLKEKENSDKSSIGIVRVASVDKISIKRRTSEDKEQHQWKLDQIRSQIQLFDEEQLNLEFQTFRIHMRWRCGTANKPVKYCPGHSAGILDWGLGELGRRKGENVAKKKMEEIADLSEHDLHLFMGNFKAHPKQFGIIGLWYPKHRDQAQGELGLE